MTEARPPGYNAYKGFVSMVDFLGFLILLAISIGVRFVGVRLVPLAMPEGRVKVVALGLVGGLVGNVLGGLWGLGPQVSTVYLSGAVMGTALFMLAAGIAPFLKIMLGKK